MLKNILGKDLYKYPYSEGDDNVRKVLLEYVKQEGIMAGIREKIEYNDISESFQLNQSRNNQNEYNRL